MTLAATRRRQPLNGTKPERTAVRVAVYTRKSTDDGLDQAFNSLDAQRQAVEAYVQSQRGEGWVALAEKYDDGGFSGGNTDRPAFQRLLRDIEAGKVDVVGVYKMDRLSRSVLDFLQTMEFFRKYGVTFVSVTQRIDTTGSMGELMSHLLVAFGQFERKVISERTADKMSAARRKGMWTGGSPILGYDLVEKKLVVNAEEAKQVREIFRLYLNLGSLLPVVHELKHRAWRNKTWTTEAGRVVPGRPFDKTALRRLLTNPAYSGKVAHRGEVYDGAHEAIIDHETWTAVQEKLKHNRRTGGREVRNKLGALLKGLVRCGGCGSGMTTHYTARGDRRYLYYVCQTAQKKGAAVCPGSRIPVGELDRFVVEHIRDIGKDPSVVAATLNAACEGVEARKPEVEAEIRRQDQERRRLEGERRNLLDAVAQGGSGTAAVLERLGEVDEEIQTAAGRVEEVRAELDALDAQVIDEADLRAALESFEPVWDQLFPREKCRILALLLEAVVYDGKAGEVSIKFRPGGVRTLSGELREQLRAHG
jgi:site-specific DNA recombinase